MKVKVEYFGLGHSHAQYVQFHIDPDFFNESVPIH